MRIKAEKKHMADLIFVLSLFGVFAVSALLAVLIGANVFRSSAEHFRHTSTTRTALAYLTEKVRQNDTVGGISIGKIEGTDALILHSTYNDKTYDTYIYAYDGNLQELFVSSSASPQRKAGQVIGGISGFNLEQVTDRLFLVSLTGSDGQNMSVYLSPKCS